MLDNTEWLSPGHVQTDYKMLVCIFLGRIVCIYYGKKGLQFKSLCEVAYLKNFGRNCNIGFLVSFLSLLSTC